MKKKKKINSKKSLKVKGKKKKMDRDQSYSHLSSDCILPQQEKSQKSRDVGRKKKQQKTLFTVGLNCKVYKVFLNESFWYLTRDISQDSEKKKNNQTK